ncbi:MAG: class I tRNA ligase family protein, partial [Bacilli bacterium]|nr:class I tRNA ligase family protein [Bacilli bacterium]
IDKEFIDSINTLDEKVTSKMNEYKVSDAISEIFNVLRDSNKYIDETTPWVLAKDESKKDRLETVIYNLLESIRVCGILLEPFMPDTSKNILKQLNIDTKDINYVENNKYSLSKPEILFARIDKDKFFEENK